MSDPDRPQCNEALNSLVAQAMELEDRPPATQVAAHLEGCEACSAFARNLTLTRGAFREATVVAPELRHRTLFAVAQRPQRHQRSPLWLLPPAVVLGVVFSFVLPLWLVNQLLRPFFGASPLTVALGLAAVCSQALLAAATLYLSIALNRRPASPLARPVLEV